MVRIMPGSHENIFMEPNVKALAHALRQALEEAQQNQIPNSKLQTSHSTLK